MKELCVHLCQHEVIFKKQIKYISTSKRQRKSGFDSNFHKAKRVAEFSETTTNTTACNTVLI